MRRANLIFCILVFFISSINSLGQDNLFAHYFAATSYYNPALAGDTRNSQFHLIQRTQPTSATLTFNNTLLSYSQKLRNTNSGIGVSFNRKSSNYTETQLKINYSHTFLLKEELWIKGGLGVSINTLNTGIKDISFPDQYNRYGLTGEPTAENFISEKGYYPGFAAGFAAYGTHYWFSLGIDNFNRPAINFEGNSVSYAPVHLMINTGYMFRVGKNNISQRLITPNGGLESYSQLGPVISYIRRGRFQVIDIGVSAYTKPVYWGLSYRYNSISSDEFKDGLSSINLLLGYRMEELSIAYSNDFVISDSPINIKSGHEVSLIYYLGYTKEDYKKHELVPLPNQLKY